MIGSYYATYSGVTILWEEPGDLSGPWIQLECNSSVFLGCMNPAQMDNELSFPAPEENRLGKQHQDRERVGKKRRK